MIARILVVEDEAGIANYLKRGLAFAGYKIESVATGARAIATIHEQQPDLILLDLGLPDLDGLEVAHQVRAISSAAIIIISARSDVSERIAGLEQGADDYLTKPFAFEELLARVQVQLRRQQTRIQRQLLRFGPIVADSAAREVRVGAQRVDLTTKEFALLEVFLHNQRQVLSREQLYLQVWGYDFGSTSNVLEVYIRTVRNKLAAAGAPNVIHTVRSVGYVLREPD